MVVSGGGLERGKADSLNHWRSLLPDHIYASVQRLQSSTLVQYLAT